MSEQTTTWPDLAIGLFEKLTGRGAEITWWMVSFHSPAAFRRALKGLRQPPAGMAGATVSQTVLDGLHPRAVLLRVGDEVIGEIVPGEPTSLHARMAGLRIPGLRLRSGRVVRALLAGD